jgi:uncharacterized alpha-E superfamily protein
MLSRVADSLYWMSRYLESAEHTARLIDVDFSCGWINLRKRARDAGCGCWRLHRSPPPKDGKIDADYAHARSHARQDESILHFFVRDGGARESAPGARAVQHGNVGAAQSTLSAGEQHHRERGMAAALVRIFSRRAGRRAPVSGVTDSTMSHGEGWQYIQLGRFVERTDAVARLIGAYFSRLAIPLDHQRWRARNIWSGWDC